MVSRAGDPHDRRSRLAVLTGSGRTAYTKGRQIQEQAERELFGALTESESATLHVRCSPSSRDNGFSRPSPVATAANGALRWRFSSLIKSQPWGRTPSNARHCCFRGRGCRRSRRPRRAHAQPEEHRPHPAAGQADHLHRRQRIGEVVARLRHDLRRRAAPLRRVAVGLRPAVPRADGEARRRSHRGHLRRRSPSARRTASAIRARRSAPTPRSTTTCGCCSRASAGPSAASAAGKSSARRPKSSPASSARCRKARGC